MSSESKVGLVVVAFIAVSIFFTFKMGGDRFPWQAEDGYKVDVLFESISGLEPKSIVRYAGVEIGIVDNIVLIDGKAKVSLKLKPDIQIRDDAEFEIGSMGLMGEKYVMIQGGSSKADWLKENAEVEGKRPMDMDRLVSVMGEIGEDVKSITGSLRQAIGGEESNRLEKIIENVDTLTESLAKTSNRSQDDIVLLIENFRIISADLKTIVERNQSNISNSIQNIDQVTLSLARTMPDIMRDLQEILADLKLVMNRNQGNLDETFENVAQGTDDFQSSMNSISNVVDKIEKGEGSLGKLIQDDEFHENLNTALKDIDKAAVEMKSFLGQASSYRFFVGYRGEYLSTQSEMKNYVSFKLQPRPDKYYLIEVISSPTGNYFEKEYEVSFAESPDEDFPNPFRFTLKTWERTQFTYSMQFAKIFHGVTFRGGLIESTGGFGFDVNFLRDHFVLSLDSWDFSRDSNPHLKLGSRINLTENFYISGGWDDFLETDANSYFFGAGLYLEDEDLKMLLSFFPLISGS